MMVIYHNKHTSNSGTAGFTLLELLVVLGILAGTTVLVLSSFRAKPEGTILRQHALNIAAILRHERARAIRQNQDTAFVLDMQTGLYRLEHHRKPRQLPSTVTIQLLTAQSEIVNESTGRIRFFPDGSSTGGTLILSSTKFQEHIFVDWLTGAVTLKQETNQS
ncbi:MAG: GspH/FimT family pseudopilin [Pseudomonadota bacterium]